MDDKSFRNLPSEEILESLVGQLAPIGELNNSDSRFVKSGCAILMERWWKKLDRWLRWKKGVVNEDHRRSILVLFYKSLLRDLHQLEYRSEAEWWGLIYWKLNNARADFFRLQQDAYEHFPIISLFESPNSETSLEYIDVIEENFDNQIKEAERDYVWRLAQRTLSKPTESDQLELVRRKLFGKTLDPSWSDSWVYTTWHRIGKKLKAAIKVEDLLKTEK